MDLSKKNFCANIFILLAFVQLAPSSDAHDSIEDDDFDNCHNIKCPKENKPIWATDYYKCYVFQSPCQLTISNCHRQKRSDPLIQMVDQENCTKYPCKQMCPRLFWPMCGVFDGVEKIFSNECELNVNSCLDKKLYMLRDLHRCERNRAANENNEIDDMENGDEMDDMDNHDEMDDMNESNEE